MIRPSILFFDGGNPDFGKDGLGDTGKNVDAGFEYNSGTNPRFLSIDEIGLFNQRAGIG